MQDEEDFEQAGKGFPELDEAARSRARARVADGVQVQAAYAQESVMSQLIQVYNS